MKAQLKVTRIFKQEISDTIVTTGSGSQLPVQMSRSRESELDRTRFETSLSADARDISLEGTRVEAGSSQRVTEPQVVLKEEPGRLKFD